MSNSSAENLFRSQAVRALRKKTAGRPICLAPRPWNWLSTILISGFIGAAIFLANVEYARKEAVRGWLVSNPGAIRISNTVSAMIHEVVRAPGDRVDIGDALVYLSTEPQLPVEHSKVEQQLEQLRRDVYEIDAQLALTEERVHVETMSLAKQIKELDSETQSLRRQIASQEARVELGEDKMRRLSAASSGGAISELELIQQQQAVGALEQELSALRQRLASRQRERELLSNHRSGLRTQAQLEQSSLRVQRSTISQKIAEHELRRRSVLTSPIGGTIASVEARAGNIAAPHQLLMTVLPDDIELSAEVYLPSRAAGFIRTGQHVRLAYDAFPRQSFGVFDGHVAHVSEFVLFPGDVPPVVPVIEASYKVRVDIASARVETQSGDAFLRPGMLLMADIVIEKKSLFDWLVDSIYAI